MDEPTHTDLKSFYAQLAQTGLIRRLLELARDEDLGPEHCDQTTSSVIAPDTELRCAVVARQTGVVAGSAVLCDLVDVFGFTGLIEFNIRSQDGSLVRSGQPAVEVIGNAGAILTIERTMLNLFGRLSGVATLTRRFVDAMGQGSHAKLFDTRKTTPGLRMLEKYAVRSGGGMSHRLGLYDAIMIKDNHLAGMDLESVLHALSRKTAPAAHMNTKLKFVEVEVDSLAQFEVLLKAAHLPLDIVLLDNFELEDTRSAVRMRDEIRPELLLEVSGGVNLDTIAAIAATGVERISVGALTHSAVNLDFGLDAI